MIAPFVASRSVGVRRQPLTGADPPYKLASRTREANMASAGLIDKPADSPIRVLYDFGHIASRPTRNYLDWPLSLAPLTAP